jgi:hypothetical protein
MELPDRISSGRRADTPSSSSATDRARGGERVGVAHASPVAGGVALGEERRRRRVARGARERTMKPPPGRSTRSIAGLANRSTKKK